MRQIIAALVLMVGLSPLARADEADAVRTLAEQGDIQAQYVLGTMYRDGQGVVRDYDEALRWLRSAGDLGLLDAQFALGNLYAGGAGIARDNVLAHLWYELATRHPGGAWLSAIAGSNRDAIAARMTDAEISEAQRLTEAWSLKHGK